MPTTTVTIAMNGVTGRMGRNQHLERSILANREQGGVALPDGAIIWPNRCSWVAPRRGWSTPPGSCPTRSWPPPACVPSGCRGHRLGPDVNRLSLNQITTKS